jgi:TRAP-type C4-dicarboxylate transport system substrate-binding protein
MLKIITYVGLIALALSSSLAAEPIQLKLAYFSSDREPPYASVMKPFADAVNKEAKGILEIKLLPGGVLGRSYGQQAQLVMDGTADMAWVNPSLTPDLFADGGIMQLPGLFRDLEEATMAHTAIMRNAVFRGYQKFYVIGSFANYPLMIHTRSRVASLADLRGKRIRANNLIEVETLEALGISSIVLPINEISLAIARAEIAGTTMPPGSLLAYGISRMTRYHYAAELGAAPLNFLMSRAAFEGLPTAGQDAIRKFSGRWTAERFIQAYQANNDAAMSRFESEADRTIVYPSKEDLRLLDAAFRKVGHRWASNDPHNAELLKMIQAEVANLRTESVGQRNP